MEMSLLLLGVGMQQWDSPCSLDTQNLCNHQVHGRVVRARPCSLPATDSCLCVPDVDECELGMHGCQAGSTCHNTKGSFYCQARQRCMEGFLQDPEGNCVGEWAGSALQGCLWKVSWVGGGLRGFRDQGDLPYCSFPLPASVYPNL